MKWGSDSNASVTSVQAISPHTARKVLVSSTVVLSDTPGTQANHEKLQLNLSAIYPPVLTEELFFHVNQHFEPWSFSIIWHYHYVLIKLNEKLHGSPSKPEDGKSWGINGFDSCEQWGYLKYVPPKDCIAPLGSSILVIWTNNMQVNFPNM